MVHLSHSRPDLCLLDTEALLETSLVVLDGPRPSAHLIELINRHLRVVGCPVLRVSIRGDCPKHSDEPIPSEMRTPSFRPNLNSTDRNIAGSIRVDLSVGLETSEGVMGGRIAVMGLASSGLGATEGSLSSYHEVYAAMFIAPGWVPYALLDSGVRSPLC